MQHAAAELYLSIGDCFMDEVKIMVATVSQAKDVSEIARYTFYETWRKTNTETDMQVYMQKSFDPEKIRLEISEEFKNIFLLAFVNEAVAGYAKLIRDSEHAKLAGKKSIELERIYVKKEYQKKKIGKQLMDRCLELANAENYFWLWLGVFEKNHTAIEFYKQYERQSFFTRLYEE